MTRPTVLLVLRIAAYLLILSRESMALAGACTAYATPISFGGLRYASV